MAEISFEEAMNRLEEIANILEQGSQTLEETIELFEEGNKLFLFCEEKLEKAENKLHILTKENNHFKLETEIEE
ncbi:exodeoxyribonuclease VII small subunit [candidate division KSB1 bacterium]|nr:exodeoxyribonuclease VII small subunit [candidate division KSB1 bacterium]